MSLLAHTRWGDCSHNWTEVRGTYGRDYGVPLGDAVEVDVGRFERQYSNVNVSVDCGKDGPTSYSFTWRDHGQD